MISTDFIIKNMPLLPRGYSMVSPAKKVDDRLGIVRCKVLRSARSDLANYSQPYVVLGLMEFLTHT